jgi:NAD(P)-dependent dehydrogenase (short-subunit alcohol dehydrogenase family)
MISKVLFNVMASSENKTVIITGCSSGIGLATTLVFLSQKARVFGIDMSPFTHELDARMQYLLALQNTARASTC